MAPFLMPVWYWHSLGVPTAEKIPLDPGYGLVLLEKPGQSDLVQFKGPGLV